MDMQFIMPSMQWLIETTYHTHASIHVFEIRMQLYNIVSNKNQVEYVQMHVQFYSEIRTS